MRWRRGPWSHRTKSPSNGEREWDLTTLLMWSDNGRVHEDEKWQMDEAIPCDDVGGTETPRTKTAVWQGRGRLEMAIVGAHDGESDEEIN